MGGCNRLDQVAEKVAFVTLFWKIFCCEKTKEVQLVGPTTVQEKPGACGEVIGGHQTQRHSGFELRLYQYWEDLLEVLRTTQEQTLSLISVANCYL